ncbi:hypothetical protein JOM56_009965 [Amanita muscaria]
MPRIQKQTVRDNSTQYQSQIQCPYCQKSFNQRGFGNHKEKCKKNQLQSRLDKEIEAQLLMEERQERAIVNTMRTRRKVVPPWEDLDGEIDAGGYEPVDQSDHVPVLGGDDGDGQAALDGEFMEKGNIRTEYHPHSGRAPTTKHYEDYRHRAPAPLPAKQSPWLPFRSRTEFSIAKIILEAGLTEKQTNVLTKAIHKAVKGEDVFEISNYREMCELWDRVALSLTPFEQAKVSAQYKESARQYDLYYKPLWDWAVDLLSDPQLAPLFEWDAQRVFRYDGTNMIRFYDEPWAGDRFWELQDKLPPSGKPLCVILYADKAKLSSFGTQKGYPVIARCANLPSDIRHGTGLGGGRVVGWLPVVEDEAAEKGKSAYADFKRAIWHNSFLVILESISTKSKTGVWFTCGDGVQRHLFPVVFALSADYEEQSVMALIRGTNSKYPCPVCLVPKPQMSDLTIKHPLRHGAESQRLYDEATVATTKAMQNEILKAQSLRLVPNAFWTVQHSDPHRTLSWDRMHNYPHGLGGKHIWPLLKKHIEDLPRSCAALVDNGYADLPRWPNLNHFSQVLNVHFSDANKYEDILKLAPFILQNVLTNESSRPGFLLLCCLRSFLKLNMYAALRVHTDITLVEGEAELSRFSSLISEYSCILTPDNEGASSDSNDDTEDVSTKNWNFPKMHTQVHLFDDIRAKGATRHYNTKPNEQMHGPLRRAYLFRTNFKNVAPQILQVNHWVLAAQVVQDNIDVLDTYYDKQQTDTDENECDVDANDGEAIDAPGPAAPATIVLDRIVFKSPVSESDAGCSFRQLETSDQTSNEPLLLSLRSKVTGFLRQYFQDNQIHAPYPAIRPNETFIEYRAMRVYYESMVDWKITWDTLRCNPSFYGARRHDHVMINVGLDLVIFARLLFLFIYHHPGQPEPYNLAYILPLDAPVGNRRQKDRLLGLQLLCAQPSARVIDARSIIRGAYIVPDGKKDSGRYYVVDTIDGDMFLRLRRLLPNIYDSDS